MKKTAKKTSKKTNEEQLVKLRTVALEAWDAASKKRTAPLQHIHDRAQASAVAAWDAALVAAARRKPQDALEALFAARSLARNHNVDTRRAEDRAMPFADPV